MHRVTTQLNHQVPPVASAARVRHWLRVGGKIVQVDGGADGVIAVSASSVDGAMRIAYETHDAEKPWQSRRGFTAIDRTARVGQCLIVPRARLDIDAVPSAVLVEFQAQDPRAIVRVAA